MTKKRKVILIDADIISHFISGGMMYMLPHIFKYKIVILDKVYAELEKWPSRKREVNNLLEQQIIEMIHFPEDNQSVKKEYFRIKKIAFLGDGEASCMAVARFSDDIIGSSNLKDIRAYCEEHNIIYLTTMDFLCEAIKVKKLNPEACNIFISKVLAAGSKLPVSRMEDWVCREITIV